MPSTTAAASQLERQCLCFGSVCCLGPSASCQCLAGLLSSGFLDSWLAKATRSFLCLGHAHQLTNYAQHRLQDDTLSHGLIRLMVCVTGKSFISNPSQM